MSKHSNLFSQTSRNQARRASLLLSLSLLVSSLFFGACTTTGVLSSVELPPSMMPHQREFPGGNVQTPVDTLLDRVLKADGDPRALKEEVDTQRALTPDDGRLHAAAAYLAEVLGDEKEQWRSLLLAAADFRRGHSRLFVEEALALSLTVKEQKTTMLFMESLLPKLSEGERAFFHHRLANFYRSFGDSKNADRHSAAIGFIDDVYVTGVFDNDQGKGFARDFGVETQSTLDEERPGLLLPARFRPLAVSTQNKIIDFPAVLSPSRFVVAYAALDVQGAREGQVANLHLSSQDALRVFQNGALIFSQEHVDRFSFDNMVIPLVLDKGANTLLIKSAQRGGLWRLGIRITDDKGTNIGAQSIGPPTLRLGAKLPEVKSINGEVKKLSPGWNALLQSRKELLAGFSSDALIALRPLLSAASSSLVHLHAARVFSANDEEGKALDSLNKAVALSSDAQGALNSRASYYKAKKQTQKAQRDLTLNPDDSSRRRRSLLIQTYRARGFTLEALAEARRFFADESDLPAALFQLESLQNYRGRYEEAARLNEKILKWLPGSSSAHRRRATLLKRQLRYLDALDEQRLVQKLDPQWLAPKFAEIELLRLIGEDKKALKRLKEIQEMNPYAANAFRLAGDIYFEQGQREEAITRYQDSAKRDPDNSRLADRLDELAPTGLGIAQEYVPSPETLESLIAEAKSMPVPTGAQVVHLLDSEVTEVASDGGAKRVVTQVDLAVGVEGRDRLTKTRIPSGPKTKLLRAYSIRPDGERQEASSVRQGEIRFRALAPGSITVVQYVHYASSGGFLPNHFFAEWYFEGQQAAFKDSKWVLILPKTREFVFEKSEGISMEDVEKDDRRIVTFSAKDSAPFLGEPFMPPARDSLKKVSVSTLTSWDEYVEWERALLSQVFNTDPEITALAKKLSEGEKSPRQKLQRLYRYVTQEIRYQQDYETSIAGVKPHACPVVLARGYGDCKDKAVLLISLAKEIGIDVDFAILRTRGAGKVLKKIPNQQFNHAIAYVPKQEGMDEAFFMDPTTDALDLENLRSDDQGVTALVLDPESGAWSFKDIPYRDSTEEFQRYVVRVDVEAQQKAKAVTSLVTRGGIASRLRQLFRNPERAEKFHQGITARFLNGSKVTGATVSDIDDLVNPLRIEQQLDASATLVNGVEDSRITLPSSSMFPLAPTTRLAERKYSMLFGPPETLYFDFVLSLPKGAKLSKVPGDIKVTSECFTYERVAVLGNQKRNITLRSAFERTCAEVSASQYEAFKSDVEKVIGKMESEIRYRWTKIQSVQHSTPKDTLAQNTK